MTFDEKAAKIKTFCEKYHGESEMTKWPTFREVSKAIRMSIRDIREVLESHDYGMERTYYYVDWDKVPAGDFYLEIY